MLQLSGAFINRPVMSLRTGGQVAMATAPIINPNNLKIEGWYCQDRFSKEPVILLSQDVRDVIAQGLVVNDHDVLTPAEELVRLRPILELQYELLGKPVFSDKKRRLGKLNDYAVDIPSLFIKKLYVSQSIVKSFSGGNLSIDRDQVIEITQRKIIVSDPLQPVKAKSGPLTVPA
jgi:sporulation protein YlmC with PRC-barrel domain